MAITQNTFTGNGSNLGPFTFTFKWLESTDVKVTVNGVLKTAGTHYNLQALNYTTKDGGQVLFTAGNAPAANTVIRIYRDTDDSALPATFFSGSAIRSQDLNDDFTQNLYSTQEVKARYLDRQSGEMEAVYVPATSTSVVTKGYMETNYGVIDEVGFTRWRQVATSGQTAFSGAGSYGNILSFVPTREQVYLNGALQQINVDYTTNTAGTTITFSPSLTAGDVVDVVCINNLVQNSTTNSDDLDFVQAGTGAVTRSVGSKLRDIVSVKDFGAVGDGVTDDTAAIQAAESSNYVRIYVPEGVYNTTLTSYQATNKIYYGPGQIKFGGYAAAKSRSFVVSLQSIPSTNRLQIFDSLNKTPESYYRFVNSGANPSPLPTTYTNYDEWSQRVGVYDFTGGFNTNAGDHTLGRSGAFAQIDKLYHGGQGDLVGRSFYGEVYSNRSGATHFLANPALVVENGNLGVSSASGAGCYLNHSEYNFSDGGYAIACIDRVRNYNRTNSGNTLSQVWIHDRPQTKGTQPIDSFYSVAGSGKVGLDFTPATLTANKAAITLKAEDRIYFESSSTPDSLGSKWYADTLGSTYLTSLAGGFITMVSSGNIVFQTSPSDVFCLSSNGLNINSTGLLRFGGTGQHSTGTSTAAFTATNKPGPTTGASPARWLKVVLSGSAYYIPCWAE